MTEKTSTLVLTRDEVNLLSAIVIKSFHELLGMPTVEDDIVIACFLTSVGDSKELLMGLTTKIKSAVGEYI